MAHYDIFRHQLLSTAPAYGYALWNPDPGNLYPAVEVGDVGYIHKGRFHRLFNVLLPANHPSHRNGVPEYYEQLDIENHIINGTLSPHNFCSASVTLGPESGYQADGPKQGEVSFLCRMNQGAVLCLPIKAKEEDTVAITRFGKWMIRHIDTWFAWAQQLELGVDRMEDIILVTGTHRTRSCTNVAFPGGREDAQVSFRANLKMEYPSDVVTINWQFSHEHIRGAHLNPGPDGKDLPEDQCIFIRGFRVIRKYKIFPRLKGAAGPNPDPEGYNEEPDMELESIPAVPEYRDPLHILLGFIAEETPNCDMVLVHDDDLAALHGIYDSTPIEYLQEAMLSHLRGAELKIHEIPFGVKPLPHPRDLLSADNGGNADTETVRVATLSNLFEELLIAPSSISPSSQSLYHAKASLPRIERVPLNEWRTPFQSSESGDNWPLSLSLPKMFQISDERRQREENPEVDNSSQDKPNRSSRPASTLGTPSNSSRSATMTRSGVPPSTPPLCLPTHKNLPTKKIVQDTEPDAKYRCTECNLQFGTPRDLSRHLNKTARHGGQPSPCAICHKPLTRPDSRARHERRCRERFGVTEEMWRGIERERQRGRRESVSSEGVDALSAVAGNAGEGSSMSGGSPHERLAGPPRSRTVSF